METTLPLRILVAGGAGFIGSRLTSRLLDLGHSVAIVDNLITGSSKHVLAARERGAEIFLGDICEYGSWSKRPWDWIFNLASPASPRDFQNRAIEILQTNSEGHRNLLELAAKTQARLLYTSSSEIYGMAETSPQTESYWGHVNPIGPRSSYTEGKRFGEAQTVAFHRTHKVDVRIVRLFNVYGPGMSLGDGRLIPNLVYSALTGTPMKLEGDGFQTRSLCYVDDIVEGILRVMSHPTSEPLNLGNPEEQTIRDVIRVFEKVTGRQVHLESSPYPDESPLHRKPDIQRAARLLQWTPKVTLEEGLHRTWSDFLEREQSGAELGLANLIHS